MAESSSAVSGTFRAIGPSTGRQDQPSARFSEGTSPALGRKPTMPQKAAGLRREPPVSEPEQSGAMPVASATAEPPDEPPAARTRSTMPQSASGTKSRKIGLP